MSKDAKHIIRLIAKYFEPPCQYSYGDIDAYEFLNAVDADTGIEWCEENCGKATPYDCWVHFFNVMQKCENEMLEYGKEQYEKEN